MVPDDTWNALPYQPMRPRLPGDVEEEKTQAENRLLLGIFNNKFPLVNTWRPFTNPPNRLPISFNPNFNNPFANFDACTSPSGESGICTLGSLCSLFGGRPSGSCSFGKVCCINVVTTCGGTVTLNNTYWQSPSTGVSASSTCALKIRTDSTIAEQSKKPICPIRLDFISFTTAQPTVGTCTDTFTVSGATTATPVICGDNSGQQMYLNVPSSDISPNNVQLIFTFSPAVTTRTWNIKIAMLPCGATYLAPADCLQYFSAASGRVKSFNWMDVAGTATRQLNNQNSTFASEPNSFHPRSKTTQMCVSVCAVTLTNSQTALTTAQTTVTNAQTAVVTAQAALTAAQTALANALANSATLSGVGTSGILNRVNTATCLYDFLLIAGARDSTNAEADRFFGNALNPAIVPVAASVQVCSPMKPFQMTHRTDGTENAVVAGVNVLPAPADSGNVGFCLDYQEK
uniref:CUB domain-containing protein n=1 Tax=Daphnia galeata TaxID=27404 RepID=A0A8J2RR22_9CRUS|nr:unnamed protein product [Daphnia galeata]